MRSTTSFCSIKCISITSSATSLNRNKSGVEILYGRLPTIFFLPSMLLKSNCNTSPSCITNLSANGKVFRRRMMSRSISQTCRRLSFFAKGSVMAAKPGPISITISSGCGLTALTISLIIRVSCKKFCPKRFRALCSFISFFKQAV